MINLIEANPYVGLDLSVFDHNLSLPRHRWYEFKEGFSERLVRSAVSDVSSRSRRRKKLHILDPFAGSGTTLVTAGRMNLEATGVEVNPFLAFAARAKCASGSWERKDYEAEMKRILSDSQHEVVSSLEGKSTFTEHPKIKKWLFNRSVLRGFTAIEQALAAAEQYRDPLRLALFSSLMECCNARRDGKCLRYRKEWESQGLNSNDLRRIFQRRALTVFNDITQHKFDGSGISVALGDAREQLRNLRSNSFDLMVTSPPYLNSFDYSDIYRPELFAGGYVQNNAELSQLRLQTIRSHVQVDWKPSEVVSSPMIPQLVARMAKGNLWNKKLPAMVQSYFTDMADILRESARLVRAHGQAWIVVSTSAYGGIEVPVDLILADVATRNGWILRGVNVLRQLRAAGQHWAHLEHGTKLPLRESLVILERLK